MKKALSLVLAVVMLIGMVPMAAFAAEETESTEHPEESEIPNGYVRVEYVESHGAESVDIGYSNIDAQRSYEYDITYSITNIAPTATKGMLGTLTIDSSKTGAGRYTNRTGMLCVRADGTTRVAFGSPAAVNAPAKWDTTLDMVNVRASVNVEQNTYTVWKDGMAVITDEVISGSPLSEHNWSVFDDSAVSEDPMSGTEYAEGRVYALKIWQDDELVRNLVPCYGRDEKEYGLYDLVEGVFYGDTNGGTLTGPDENGGCLVTLTAPEGVDVQVFSGFTKGSLIEPTDQETVDGETAWTYSLSVGNYHFLSSGSDYYTLQKNFFVTAADVWDEDGNKHIDADPGKRSGDGWEYSSGQTRYEYTDEVLASAAMDTTALREKYPEAVATPAFTISKADGAYTTQAEMEAFIAELDRAAENMYVYSAGASTNGHDLPLVVFTQKDIAGLELEDAAKLVAADGKPIIFFHAQIHGNEPAASEGALAIISGLCGNWGAQVLDQVNIIIMPRVNPDGAENYNRNNQAGKDLNRDNLLLVYPETRAVHRVYNLFEPEVVVDLHEYYLSTTSAIGNLDDYGIESSSNQSNTADLNSLSHELKYYVMGQTASEGIRGFDYYQSGYSNQNPLVVSHYYALRGSLGILIETPGITATKANFERRVLTDYVAARKIVEYVCNNSQKILETVTQDRASTTQKGSTYEESDLIVLKHGVNPTGNTFSRPTYDLTDGSVINANATDTCRYYEQILRSRSRPTAYVLGADTANISRILEIMDYHAISYYYLAPEEAVALRGYASDGTSVVLTEEASITFESGAYVFPMNQSSGLVLALMMEPDVDKCDHNPITFVQTGVLTESDIYRCERNLVNGRIPGFHEHSYETTITAPTCTEQGYTTYTCTCGDGYVDGYVDALGHSYANGVCTDCGQYQPVQLVNGFNLVSGIEPGDSRLLDTYSINAPFIYQNLTQFENCNISSVTLFVTGTLVDNGASDDPEIDDNTEYTFDIQVIDSNSVKAGEHYTVKETYTISVLGSEIKKNDWNTLDVSHLGIFVREGETLGFGSAASTLETFYLTECTTSKLCYWGHNSGTDDTALRLRNSSNLLIGVEGYCTKTEEDSNQNTANREQLKAELSGKYLSVFGASMCTFEGYSNDANTNTTIGNNEIYYVEDMEGYPTNYPALPHRDDLEVEDTFWMQIVNELDMNLLVNNSWSGSRIIAANVGAQPAYIDRCRQLHADTGVNSGIDPDAIVSFMGYNDYSNSATVLGEATVELFADIKENVANNDWRGTTFAECYAMMVARMVDRYPNAEIFLFNMPYNTDNSLSKAESYHAVISAIAEHYGCYVIDLAHSEMSGSDYDQYSLDGLHPNAEGMDIWTELILEKMSECYLNSEKNHTHTYESAVTAPTCTEQGYTTYTCTCGDSYVSDYVDALGHDYSAGLCTVCGEDTVTASLEGNILTLAGELTEGTRVLVACYNDDGRLTDVKIFIWQGSPIAEEIPIGETIKLFFVDKNWSPLRQFVPLR